MTPPVLRIALHNDFQVVALGLLSMLEPFGDRIKVVEVDSRVPVLHAVDITLYDTFGRLLLDGDDIDGVLASENAGAVVVYSWDMHRILVDRILAKGCRGYLTKSLNGEELVTALEQIQRGDIVVSAMRDQDQEYDLQADDEKRGWPGKDMGLSAREAEVVALITQGLTNKDIAARSYLSINSVKSYVRNAYRKIGVERRSQAVRWGMENDMLPDLGRTIFE